MGECKRNAGGLVPVELEKLDKLTARLRSRWSFVSTLDPSRTCEPIWKESIRSDGKHSRLVVTGDRLFSMHPATLVAGAVEWVELNDAQAAQSNEQFIQTLSGFNVLERLIGERHVDDDLLEYGFV
jgi:hypothetical protein